MNETVQLVAAMHLEELEDGDGWFVSCDTYRGAWGHGDTREAAIEDYLDSLEAWVRCRIGPHPGDEPPVTRTYTATPTPEEGEA